MRDTFLQFQPPLVGEDEIQAIADTIRSGWLTTGPKVQQFQEEFVRRFGSPAALGLNSCTAALHTALVALGIGAGDEVITTPMTFASTVNVIEQVGATPVLADVEPDTLNISPAEVASKVTARTRADLDALWDVAHAHGITMVEDAAHAISAKYRGRFMGSGDNLVAFSFYATKNLTTGEGGMLTGSPELIEKAKVISLHGMSHDAWNRYSKEGNWYYEVVMPGFKYNMMDIQAAMGLAQIAKLESMQCRREAIVHRYMDAFSSCASLECPVERSDVKHAWQLFPLRLNLETLKIDRAQFIKELRKRNIGSSVHFIPIHLHPFYRDKYGYKPTDFPVAYGNYLRLVSLPLSPAHSDRDVDDVIEVVLEIVHEYRR
jgi:dTDP-4-amino-4,6-dideoxygalactose transaminase